MRTRRRRPLAMSITRQRVHLEALKRPKPCTPGRRTKRTPHGLGRTPMERLCGKWRTAKLLSERAQAGLGVADRAEMADVRSNARPVVGKITTDSSPEVTRADAFGRVSACSSTPIVVAATINGSDVACSSPATIDFR